MDFGQTFGVQADTPSQNLRVLPSASGEVLLAILPEGCTPRNPSNCASLRGRNFYPSWSSTSSDLGLCQLPPDTPADALGFGEIAHCGHDTIALGWHEDGLPTHAVLGGQRDQEPIPRGFRSLALGRYDAPRYLPNNLSFHVEADIAQDLLAGIQSTRTDTGNTPLLPTGIFANDRFTVSHV
ncbi:MAG: hypothetical protein M1826_002251 [Phylliscum demangeonii]|nr:MAG: hypothetical protein M1826_002251 [Phylliscum demangeonii]